MSSNRPTFDDLPNELVQKIFAPIPAQDRLAMSLVSKRWNDNVTALWQKQECLTIKWHHDEDDPNRWRRSIYSWMKKEEYENRYENKWPKNCCNVIGHKFTETDIVNVTGNIELLLKQCPNLKALHICNEISTRSQHSLATAINEHCQQLEHFGYRPKYSVPLTDAINLWSNLQPNFAIFKCLEVDGRVSDLNAMQVTIDKFFPTLTTINLDAIVGGAGYVESTWWTTKLFEPLNVQYSSSSTIQVKAIVISTSLNHQACAEYLKTLISLEKITIRVDVDSEWNTVKLSDLLEKMLLKNKIMNINLVGIRCESSNLVIIMQTIVKYAKKLESLNYYGIDIGSGSEHWNVLATMTSLRCLRIDAILDDEGSNDIVDGLSPNQLKLVLDGLDSLTKVSIQRLGDEHRSLEYRQIHKQTLLDILSSYALQHVNRTIDIDVKPFLENWSNVNITMMESLDLTKLATNIRFYRQRDGLMFYK